MYGWYRPASQKESKGGGDQPIEVRAGPPWIEPIPVIQITSVTSPIDHRVETSGLAVDVTGPTLDLTFELKTE